MKTRPVLISALVLILVVAGTGAALGLFSTRVGQPSGPTSVLETIEPFNSYGPVHDESNIEAMRPRVMGSHGVISTGHYLATMAGIDALRAGGNAFDAGVTAAMVLKVTKMGYAGWTGVAPLILYSADEDRIITRVGAGTSPAAATLDHFLQHGKTPINTALLPADVDVWLAALERYGTASFADAARPALEVAESGYHLYKLQKWLLDTQTDGVLRFPYNQEFWFQHGIGEQRLGDLMVNRDLGRLIRYMMEAEAEALASGVGRSEGIRAARDAFYSGAPARAVGDFFREHGGLVTYDDLASYEGKWMEPLHASFMGYDVYAGDGWSQGPRLILILKMLDGVDLKSLGYNTAEYIHLLSQVIDLAMSDSHRYVADPDVVDIPEALYSSEYARLRFALIDEDRAFQDLPPWGDPMRMLPVAEESPRRFAEGSAGSEASDNASGNTTDDISLDGNSDDYVEPGSFDTSSLSVMDRDGNLFVMTESDGHLSTPMIPGWGFGLGARMEQFNLDPALANVMAPNKRPRNTNSPLVIMKDGRPFLGLSTPGGDQQLQSLLQIFLNVVVWGMPPEHAVDQPRFGSYNFPATGTEVNLAPAQLKLEDRIPSETVQALVRLGHDVQSWGLWNWRACAPTVTYRDPETGVMIAAGDVRRETSSLGY